MMGFASIGLALSLGVPAGLAAGFYGGKVDEVMMRTLDILMSFPTLLLALMVLTALGSNVVNAILAVGFVYSPRIARVVRGSTLSVKNEEFIEGAKARGESGPYIMVKEILPNVAAPIVVEGSIRIGYAIIVAASLSFLGLGAQPPTPDWGLMISQSRNLLYDTVWYLVWPSLFLGSTVMGLNLLGDGLRDVLDPQTVEE
jgi:peptide/nickel transport system permease protein